MNSLIKALSFIDLLSYSSKKHFKENASDYGILDTAYDNYTYVAYDGSMASLIEVKGSRNNYSKSDYEDLATKLENKLASILRNDKTQVDFSFMRDKDRSRESLENKMKPYMNVAKQIGFKDDFIFKSKMGFLPDHIVEEKSFIVVWTPVYVLEGNDKKEEDK